METTISTAREECYAWGIEVVSKGQLIEDAVFYNLKEALDHGRALKSQGKEFVRLIRIKKYLYDQRVIDLPSVGK